MPRTLRAAARMAKESETDSSPSSDEPSATPAYHLSASSSAPGMKKKRSKGEALARGMFTPDGSFIPEGSAVGSSGGGSSSTVIAEQRAEQGVHLLAVPADDDSDGGKDGSEIRTPPWCYCSAGRAASLACLLALGAVLVLGGKALLADDAEAATALTPTSAMGGALQRVASRAPGLRQKLNHTLATISHASLHG